jgi:prefoldin subunit 5
MARIDKLEALLDTNNTNDDLSAQINELQARLDDITDKYNALENKKQVVNKPKKAKKPARVNA